MGYTPAKVYLDLRNRIFALGSDGTIAGSLAAGGEILAVLMEIGIPNGVASLVAVNDGTVSLYYSGGGGILGLGPHEGPRRTARALLAMAPEFSKYCNPATEFPLPPVSHTCFYLITRDGVRTVVAKDEDFGYNRQELSPLFHKAQEVLTEIQRVDQQLRAESKRPS
jgi:hypothetical protein